MGAFCSIASNCRIYLGGNHHIERVTTFPFGHRELDVFDQIKGDGTSTNGDVVIGNDVWIGNDVTIMSGVSIGDGAVVAANSHVVKAVPPYALVGGNPARLIRRRFSEDQIERLLQVRWWEWPDERINGRLRLLCDANVSAFLDAAEGAAGYK